MCMTFSFTEITPKRVELYPLDDYAVSDETWQELADSISREKSLRPASPLVLSDRWRRGYAAIVVYQGVIVSYASMVPIFYHAARQRLAAAMKLDPACLPDIDVYGLSTGWTLLRWRGKGMHSQFIPQLLDKFAAPNRLYVSAAVGLAGSPVLIKLPGWRIVGWSALAFTSSLVGLPLPPASDAVEGGWRVPKAMTPYEGAHITHDRAAAHNWNRFCHLWISDMPLAAQLNDQIAASLDGDLSLWRKTIFDLFAIQRESPWTLHLFQE